MRKLLLTGLMALSVLGQFALTGCAAVKVQSACPTLVTYSAQDQKALASELRAHSDLVEVPRWLGDYVSLRDQARACTK
ncbi:hypothetical protein [Kozakia baliensis]|uniref:hypothetical protein n=1 Tax=Kozakia baliensis TaxID=153496 RepID=UPI00068CF89C|nr:hypothetical protein [Kozakia baliensis]